MIVARWNTLSYHRTEKNKDETSWYGHFSQVAQDDGLIESNKGRNWFLQAIDFAYKNIRGFCSCRDFLQKWCISLFISELIIIILSLCECVVL